MLLQPFFVAAALGSMNLTIAHLSDGIISFHLCLFAFRRPLGAFVVYRTRQ